MKLSRTAIGMAVKSARLAAGLTASQLANDTGLSASAISRTESGVRALEFVEALAVSSALCIDIEALRTLAETFEREGVSGKANAISELEADLLALQRVAIESAIQAGVAAAR
jgi:transcriptional regulator with XRE-family HTH domain